MMSFPVQTLVVQKPGKKKKPGPLDAPINLVNPDGTPFAASGLTPAEATTSTAGVVRQAAHVPDPAGDTPTKAEYVALRDALVTAGIMAAS
ncbi:hypothetical protein [Bifidobacterium phasiani]|uniref:Head fiber protein n=1 Tax=Bifidobacterium phasiani TaxID=2834431 RepID=A0ABS6W699_9BIFI|nr:hypothetical protein [Bifidobacterium phasiani]MBW3081972.1 hypothetical protein [Bifidobacterium phasiani]